MARAGRSALRTEAVESRIGELASWPAGRRAPRWRWAEAWVAARHSVEVAAATGTASAYWSEARSSAVLDAAAQRWQRVAERAVELGVAHRIRVAGWRGPTLAELPSASPEAGWAAWLAATHDTEAQTMGYDVRAWSAWTRAMARQLAAYDVRRQLRARRRAEATLAAVTPPAEPARIAYRLAPCTCGKCRRCRRAHDERLRAGEARAVLRHTARAAQLRAAGVGDREIARAILEDLVHVSGGTA